MVYPNIGLLHSTKHDYLMIKLINSITKKESVQRHVKSTHCVEVYIDVKIYEKIKDNYNVKVILMAP